MCNAEPPHFQHFHFITHSKIEQCNRISKTMEVPVSLNLHNVTFRPAGFPLDLETLKNHITPENFGKSWNFMILNKKNPGIMVWNLEKGQASRFPFPF